MRGRTVLSVNCLDSGKTDDGAPRGFGDLGRMAIFFRELGSTGNYFQGFADQAHSFGD